MSTLPHTGEPAESAAQRYDAPPLNFETIFDEPVPSLPVPCTVTAGQVPELKVVDRFTRGVAIVGRFALSPSLIGLKVQPGTAPVRVRVALSTDKVTDTWWHKRTPDDLTRPDTATGRLFLLRSQGKTRGAIYLAAVSDRPEAHVRGAVEFDLEPGALTEEGLLVLEVIEPHALPTWAQPRVMKYSPVGVRIDSITVQHADPARPAEFGSFAAHDRHVDRPDLIAVNADASGAVTARLRVRRQYPRAEVTLARAANKVVREMRQRVVRRDPAIEVSQILQAWLEHGDLEVEGYTLETQRTVTPVLALEPVPGQPDHAFVRVSFPSPLGEPVLLKVKVRDGLTQEHPGLRHRVLIWEPAPAG